MTPEEFEKDMIKIRDHYGSDYEGFHMRADELMCDLLRSFGFNAGIDIFENANKWYS